MDSLYSLVLEGAGLLGFRIRQRAELWLRAVADCCYFLRRAFVPPPSATPSTTLHGLAAESWGLTTLNHDKYVAIILKEDIRDACSQRRKIANKRHSDQGRERLDLGEFKRHTVPLLSLSKRTHRLNIIDSALDRINGQSQC